MKLAAAVLALAFGIAQIGSAQAVRLDPGGRGQALIFPYYTVNKGQQTLLSLTNPNSTAQVVKLRFREGYNGRSVLDLNVWFSPYDVWTGTIFALEDGGLPGDGAGLFTRDRSCTSPLLSASGITLSNGQPVMRFSDADFIGGNADGGPTGITRTREGWIEIIAMADLTPPLSVAATHNASSLPGNCNALQNVPIDHASLLPPRGQLMGAASIINTAQGTILATRAEALANFTGVPLFSAPGSSLPSLSSVNDGVPGQPVTAHIFDSNGRLQILSFGAPAADGRPATRAIDAISALFMADRVINEYSVTPGIGAGSDWVMTFPTKPFYTDPRLVGAGAMAPFPTVFAAPGRSPLSVDTSAMDRHGRHGPSSSQCLPLWCQGSSLDFVVNVIPFAAVANGQTAVLGSRLPVHVPNTSFSVWNLPAAEGWAQVEFPFWPLGQLGSIEGKRLQGAPAMGFWATNLVNNAVSAGVLSNYSTAIRHVTRVTCLQDGPPAIYTVCD